MLLDLPFALILLGTMALLFVINRRKADGSVRRLLSDIKDSEAADQRLQEWLAADVAREQGERAALWQRAQTDRRAAEELSRRLRDDLEAQATFRRELTPGPDAGETHRILNEQRAEAERQLADLNALAQAQGFVLRAPAKPTLRRQMAFAALLGLTVVAYVVLFIVMAQRLHLEFDAGFSIATGGLLTLIGLVGLIQRAARKRFYAAIAVYLLVAGVMSMGIGVWRQQRIAEARAACARALQAARDSHDRIRVLYGPGALNLPSLGSSARTRLSCLQLSQ